MASTFDSEPFFAQLAAKHGVTVRKVKQTRRCGLPCPEPPPPSSPQTPFEPPPPPEPAQTRTAATTAEAEAARKAHITELAAVLNGSGRAIAELGMLLTPDSMAALLAGHAMAHGSLEATAALLPQEHRRQLAPPPPPRPTPPECREIHVQTEDVPPADVAQRAADAVASMTEEQKLEHLDSLAREAFGDDERKAKSLRRFVKAMERINDFRDRDGRKQANFLLSIVEAYGAADGERLPLGSFLSYLMYYAVRPADELHWGKPLNFHFGEDGGFYMEVWRDLMNHAGHVAIEILRGYMFSGLVKAGLMDKGKFDLSKLLLEERDERLLLGAAVPSVRAINASVKPEERVDKGGMSQPLEKLVETQQARVAKRLAKATGKQVKPLAAPELNVALSRVAAARFRSEDVHAEMHGTQGARLVLPTKKESDAGKWYAREPPAAMGAENGPTPNGEAL